MKYLRNTLAGFIVLTAISIIVLSTVILLIDLYPLFLICLVAILITRALEELGWI